MRAVVQRVLDARVTVEDDCVGKIDKGLLVFLGISQEDGEQEVKYIIDKITNLRIFEDADSKMNLSLLDIQGSLLIVSQFTLYGDVRKGRRPSFDKAARPNEAKALYDLFVAECKALGLPISTGVFQAHMVVSLANDGPVTILIDSE